MSFSGIVFSETLHGITKTKLEEVAKQRTVFRTQYAELLASLGAEKDPVKRLKILISGAEKCLGISNIHPKIKKEKASRLETDFNNAKRFLEQAQYDPSISQQILEDWEKCLLQYLSVQSRKYEYAELYGRLVTEWLKSGRDGLPEDADTVMVDNPGMQPARNKKESRDFWEQTVFEPANVHTETIDQYLSKVFIAENKDVDMAKSFEYLRDRIQRFEATFSSSDPFNITTLRWVIEGLQAGDRFTNEKREVLKDFLGNEVVLAEISHVLNMRVKALDRWSWGDHVPIEHRRNLNGSYTVYMHEDLLQAMFLHYIGVVWSVFFKKTLLIFDREYSTPNTTVISKEQKARREYYLGYQSVRNSESLQAERSSIYKKQYLLHRLLDKETQQIEIEEGEEVAEQYGTAMSEPNSKRAMTAAYKAARLNGEKLDISPKNPMEAKQNILHMLSAEIIINKQLYGGLTCFHSAFKSWNPLLPHETILSVLKFFGVSEKWLRFFEKFLQAPLKFLDDDGSLPRLRVRGTPGSHTLSDVFGEVTLFCLDFAVNKATEGGMLYRVSDDFWFWSKDRKKCEAAWDIVQDFAKVMGLELDPAKTGAARISDPAADKDDALPKAPIRWGFLYLDASSGRFEIDSDRVNNNIEELRKQLQKKDKSVIEYIHAWNSFAVTFFSTNFGKPAACFGRDHIDQMLAFHRHIQEAIFDGGNVTEYLKDKIKERFAVENVSDGFLLFPAELGGLGLKSPFVNLLQIRQSVPEDPCESIRSFVKAEKIAYKKAKSQFEQKLLESDYEKPQDGWKPAENANVFFSFEEFVRNREDFDGTFKPTMVAVLRGLLKKPEEESMNGSVQVRQALEQLEKVDNLKGITSDWDAMEAYWKWIAQMYGREVIEKFGGFSLVDPGLLPIGMVNMLQQKRVEWQG